MKDYLRTYWHQRGISQAYIDLIGVEVPPIERAALRFRSDRLDVCSCRPSAQLRNRQVDERGRLNVERVSDVYHLADGRLP